MNKCSKCNQSLWPNTVHDNTDCVEYIAEVKVCTYLEEQDKLNKLEKKLTNPFETKIDELLKK